MIFSIESVSLILSGIIDLILGGLIYSKARENKNNLLFSSVYFSVSFWVLSMFLFVTFPVGSGYMDIITLCLYLSGGCMPLFFVLFSYTFPSEIAILSRKKIFLVSFPAACVLFSLLIPGFILNGVVSKGIDYKIVEFGAGYFLYLSYIIIYWCWSFLNLTKSYFRNTGVAKVQMSYVMGGTLIPILIGTYTNVLAPSFGDFHYFWLGPVTTTVMSVMISYAIIKHHLLDVRIIATEMFIGVIVLISAIEVFLSSSGSEFIGRVIVLSAISLFSFLLIRNILHEIETREYVEKLAKDLELANEHLRVLDKQKSEFVSIASHQLRTPLTAVIGYSSMLLEGSYGKLSDKASEVVDKVYQSSRRLAGTIDDFLTISHIEQGKMVYTFTTVEMRGLLSGMVEEFSVRAKNEKKTLHFTDDGNGNYNVTADDNKIRQVLSNLIDNAIKYSKEGQSIEVSLVKDFMTNKTRISIHDSGIGMSPETINNLFQKFNRAKDAQKSYADGNGIGLYIAQEMMKSYHGRIWAESEGEGKGATFFVELMSEE